MISPAFIEYAALALALLGLAAVIWEIAVKDARLFGEIATDLRKMAQPAPRTVPAVFTPSAPTFGTPANSNGLRKAA